MTQEFHICVTPVRQDDYLVRTEHVAPGVPAAQELVKLPVADWLTRLNTGWHDCLEPLPQIQANPSLAESSLNLVTLGQQLYTALFQGSLRDSWSTAQKIAQQRREILRLRLGLKETKLASLPWEILHTGDRFLATDPFVSFSRYQATTTLVPQSQAENIGTLILPSPPDLVKVLMVIATPTEQASLVLKQEAIKLQVELCQLQSSGSSTTELEFTLLEHPRQEQLLEALEQEPYQIIHYIGQSNLAASKKEPYLNFGTKEFTERLSADELASLLGKHGIQMAVFNFCRQAYTENVTSTADLAETELIQRFVKHGIKSVLTVGKCLPVEVIQQVISNFYYNIIQGYCVDFSLKRVREELICVYGFEQLYWARLILYLQPEYDGYLTTNETIDLVISDDDFEEKVELDWLDEEVADDEPTYQEDSAIVADLFRQVANPVEGRGAEGLREQGEQGDLREQGRWGENYKQTRDARKVAPTVGMVVGLVGASAIALVGLWWQHRLQVEDFLSPIYQSLLTKPFELQLKTASTSKVTAIAIEKFKQTDLNNGSLAVEELLNRGELQSANIALATVSEQQAETSEINFLRGRVVWQSIQLGDKNYSLSDVCHYWEAAVKYKPDPLYYNALGFAYYAAGNLERASQTWFQALYLVEEQAAKTTDSSIPATTTFSTNQIALNSYAGLAIILSKAALNQPSDKQVWLLSEAIKLREKVLKDDPVNFQPQNLSKNWLWTNQEIQEWRSLLQQKSE